MYKDDTIIEKQEHDEDELYLVLYITTTYDSAYLYDCIAKALWLNHNFIHDGKAPKKVNVELILLPVSPFLKQSIIRELKKILLKLPPKLGISLLLTLYKDRLTSFKTISQAKSITRANYIKEFNRQALYHKIYSGGKIKFYHENISFSINLYREHLFRHGYLWLKATFIAIKLWRQCYQDNKFLPKIFLQLSYFDIQLGDLIASHTLRTNPTLGGSLKACLGLFKNLIIAIYISLLSRNLFINSNASNYVMVPEPNYLHGVYERTLHSLGVSVISQTDYDREIKVISPRQKIFNPHILPSPNGNHLGFQVDDKSVISYMEARLSDAKQYLGYMKYGVNKNISEEIYGLNGEIININEKAINVIVFLHSFTDAQYKFGLDGFNDLIHWTVFTIDNCIKNKFIEKILVKLHPNVDTNHYPGDKVALNKIINEYLDVTKVSFVKKDCSIFALLKKGKLYGITHHGSVAEEMVYLGQPVIASAFAPWGINYPFIRTWQTIDEYEHILEAISIDTWSPPSEVDKKWLVKYLYNYRLKTIPYNGVKYYREDFIDYMIDEPNKEMLDSYEILSALTEELVPNAPLFNLFLRMQLDLELIYQKRFNK